MKWFTLCRRLRRRIGRSPLSDPSIQVSVPMYGALFPDGNLRRSVAPGNAPGIAAEATAALFISTLGDV